MSSLEKCLFGSPAHLLIGCMFFYVEMYEFFMFSGYYPLKEFVVCKYLLPFNRLPLHFKDSFLHLQKLVWCSFCLVWCRATSLSLFTFVHWRRKWQPTRSVLAWRIPGTGEPGGLPSVELHRVWHDWSDLAAEQQQQSYLFIFAFVPLAWETHPQNCC